MAFLTFTAGQILTASNMNTLSQQTVSTVTTAGRPASPVTGQPIHDTTVGAAFYWNGSAWTPQDHLRFLNTGAALAGAAPSVTGSTRWLIQAGSTVGTLSAFNTFTVTFPTAFPSGLLSVVVVNGDNTGPTSAFTFSGTTSSFGVALPGGTAGTSARVNYIAIGW